MRPVKPEEINKIASIDEISKLLKISKSKLRYYDEIGIINNKRKSDKKNAYRIYDRADLIQLMDFLLMRNLDISIKEIIHTNTLPTSEQCQELFNIVKKNQDKIQQIITANNELMQKVLCMQQYLDLEKTEYIETKNIDIVNIKEFHLWTPDHLHAWLERPYTRSYCFICANGNPSEIVEGLADAQHFESDIMWKRGDNENITYLECLTNTEYAYPTKNNLDKHFQHLKENGYDYERIICKYILTKIDEETQKKLDVYQTWIQLK